MSDYRQKYSDAAFERGLERLALGEASDAERRSLETQATARGKSLEELLAGIRESNEEIRAKYPSDMMAARVKSQINAQSRPADRARSGAASKRWFAGLGVLGSVGVVAFLFVNLPTTASMRTTDSMPATGETTTATETVRIKGAGAKLIVWRKSSDEVERLESGAVAHTGDVLQLEYNAAGASYGVIGSLDGRGSFTLHYPANSAATTRLKSGVTPLGFAYQLDDAPAFERFFFVTADKPLKVDEISHSIESLVASQRAQSGQPTLSDDTHVTSIILEKN